MPTAPLVTVPLQISPELMAKARAAIGATNKRAKLTWSLDNDLNIKVGAGIKPVSWFAVGGVFERDTAGKVQWAATGEISFAPAP